MMVRLTGNPSFRRLGWRVVNPLLGSHFGSKVSEGVIKIFLRGIGVNVGHEIDASGESWFVPRLLAVCPNAVCADVGANVGSYTDLLWANGAGRIYAFEPVPPTFARLRARIADFPALTAFNVALGEQCGKVAIHVSSDESESTLASRDSVMAGAGPAAAAVVAFEVPMVTLDSVSF